MYVVQKVSTLCTSLPRTRHHRAGLLLSGPLKVDYGGRRCEDAKRRWREEAERKKGGVLRKRETVVKSYLAGAALALTLSAKLAVSL